MGGKRYVQILPTIFVVCRLWRAGVLRRTDPAVRCGIPAISFIYGAFVPGAESGKRDGLRLFGEVSSWRGTVFLSRLCV